jgi:hypothetical protein
MNTFKIVSFHVAWTALIEWVSSMGYINLGWIVFITPFIAIFLFITYIMTILGPIMNPSALISQMDKAHKADKADKADKGDKADKADKGDKAEKVDP